MIFKTNTLKKYTHHKNQCILISCRNLNNKNELNNAFFFQEVGFDVKLIGMDTCIVITMDGYNFFFYGVKS